MTLGKEFANIKCDPKNKFATLFASCSFLLSSLGAPDHRGQIRRGRKEAPMDVTEKTGSSASYVRHTI